MPLGHRDEPVRLFAVGLDGNDQGLWLGCHLIRTMQSTSTTATVANTAIDVCMLARSHPERANIAVCPESDALSLPACSIRQSSRDTRLSIAITQASTADIDV